MNRVFNFIAISVSDSLSRDEQQLQSGNADRIRHNTLPLGDDFFAVS